MTHAAYSAHPVLAITAEAVIPALGVMTILLPALSWRVGRLNNPGLLWACGIASIILLYIVRAVNIRTGASVAETGFHFSSHTALAISFAVTLVAYRSVFLPIVAPIVAGYVWLMVILQYHMTGDALVTAAVILPLSLLCHLPWWRKRTPAKAG